MKKTEIFESAINTIDIELKGIKALKKILSNDFVKSVTLMKNCKGRVVCTGIGKSGIIARKIAATLSSTGTSSFYLNPVEGSHGDLGVLLKDDVVLALSKSGGTEELISILPYLKRRNLKIIAVTEKEDSVLAQNSSIVLLLPEMKEACPFNLAPTTSTTLQLILGDALAVALLKEKKFTPHDFALLHPGGNLGKQLMTVNELMHSSEEMPVVKENDNMEKVLHQIVDKKLGMTIVVDNRNKLKGIIVDGDFKRILLKNKSVDLFSRTASDFMTKNPKTINKNKLVTEALGKMQGKITSLVVVNSAKKPLGVIHLHDIIKKGFL